MLRKRFNILVVFRNDNVILAILGRKRLFDLPINLIKGYSADSESKPTEFMLVFTIREPPHP